MNEEFSLNLPAKQIAQLVEVYREHKPQIDFYPGIVRVLTRLRRQGKLGLLSDGFLPAQQLKLDALGLEQLFDAVVFTEKMGRECWKPSTAGFELIAEQLSAEPSGCVYVGDNPAKDFVAPNKLGWLTVQFLQPDQVHASKPTAEGGEPKLLAYTSDELQKTLLD